MILYELCGETENHEAYEALASENGARHYGFLKSLVEAAMTIDRPFLSQTVIKAINFHAIACLHTSAGEFRPCDVSVRNTATGEVVFAPPEHHRVRDLMNDFVNTVNRRWDGWDAFRLGAYVLWRLNHIHPFINGNGRTARAACYFVMCLKFGGWPDSPSILPELIREPQFRLDYEAALREADRSLREDGEVNLDPMTLLLAQAISEQIERQTGSN